MVGALWLAWFLWAGAGLALKALACAMGRLGK